MTPLRQVIKQPFDGQKFIAHCDAPRSALGKAFLPRILHKGGDVLVEKTPFRQIASLLIAGTYYLVLHRHTSTFGDMDYDTPDGPVRLKKVLHEILDMLYERLERPQRVSEAIRRLKERGVDEQVIRECLKDL